MVDRFFDNAYLGEFPEVLRQRPFAVFTEGARGASATTDLLSNAEIADQIDQATGIKRRVRSTCSP